MQNDWLDEAQAGSKKAGRNINNHIYADNITLMAESEKELKSFLMKMKEESEKAGKKMQHSKNEDHGIWSHEFLPNRSVKDFIFLGSKITVDDDCSQEHKQLAPWKKSYDKPKQYIKKQKLCQQKSL